MKVVCIRSQLLGSSLLAGRWKWQCRTGRLVNDVQGVPHSVEYDMRPVAVPMQLIRIRRGEAN